MLSFSYYNQIDHIKELTVQAIQKNTGRGKNLGFSPVRTAVWVEKHCFRWSKKRWSTMGCPHWKNFFLNISEKSYLHYWKARKYKMLFTFFHFGEKFLFKNVSLKQNNTFTKSFATKFYIFIVSRNGFQVLLFVLWTFCTEKKRYIELLILNFCTKFWILAHSMRVGVGVKPVPSTTVKYCFET